jgi:hypothetical protein
MTFEANQEFGLVTNFGNQLMTVFVKERVGTLGRTANIPH